MLEHVRQSGPLRCGADSDGSRGAGFPLGLPAEQNRRLRVLLLRIDPFPEGAEQSRRSPEWSRRIRAGLHATDPGTAFQVSVVWQIENGAWCQRAARGRTMI